MLRQYMQTEEYYRLKPMTHPYLYNPFVLF